MLLLWENDLTRFRCLATLLLLSFVSITVRVNANARWKAPIYICMKGCEQMSEASCIEYFEWSGRVEKGYIRASPFTLYLYIT